MTLQQMSLTDLRRAIAIREQQQALEQELQLLGQPQQENGKLEILEAPPKKLRWNQTPQGKRKMSRLVRAQWRNGSRAMAK